MGDNSSLASVVTIAQLRSQPSEPAGGSGIAPDLPEARERQRFPVPAVYDERLARLVAHRRRAFGAGVPLVERVGGHDAASLAERLAV